jgi:DNA-binding LytR/AlgR family response regulator
MNIAIVDDCEKDRSLLAQMIRQYGIMNQLDLSMEHFPSGEALLLNYQPFRYTVIFLDIFMEGMSGIETAEKIRSTDEDTPLVFLTASNEHHPEAFSVFATAYLTKPVTEERLFRTLNHIMRLSTEPSERFSFTAERREYSLPYAEIVSIESDGNYLIITDRSGKTYRTRMTFSRLLQQVQDPRFLVLMKGILVNMEYIELMRDSVCVMRNGRYFPLLMRKAKELKQQWLNYRFASIRESTRAAEDR